MASTLAANASPECRVLSAMMVEQMVKYLGIIRRFDRFPHRNATLARDSTPDEVEFLKTWAEMQPPKGMRPAS